MTIDDPVMRPRVRHAMTPRPATAGPRDTLRLAWDRMARGPFRHLPVLDGDRLVGIVTLWDICQGLALADPAAFEGHPLDHIRVRAVMTPDPAVVDREEPLSRAATILAERQVGALPVIDESGRLVGIVTERDIVREFAAGGEPHLESEDV